MKIQDIKINFPNEWILLGNPQFEGTKVTEGIVIFHGTDKTLLAQQGKEVRNQYNLVKFIYTGQIQPTRRLGIFKRIA
jgi:hypothetical protein